LKRRQGGKNDSLGAAGGGDGPVCLNQKGDAVGKIKDCANEPKRDLRKGPEVPGNTRLKKKKNKKTGEGLFED